jgi:hypothetical protein
MSAWVEPARKLKLFEKRLRRLRGAIKAGESLIHISNAAEKVRLAALAVIKAKRALISEYWQRDPDGQESRNLQEKEQQWLSLSTEAIAEEHGKGKDQASRR